LQQGVRALQAGPRRGRRLGGAGGQAGDVAAGVEGGPVAGEHQRLDVLALAGLHLGQRGGEIGPHGFGEDVTYIRPGKGDGRYTIGDGEAKRVVGHGVIRPDGVRVPDH